MVCWCSAPVPLYARCVRRLPADAFCVFCRFCFMPGVRFPIAHAHSLVWGRLYFRPVSSCTKRSKLPYVLCVPWCVVVLCYFKYSILMLRTGGRCTTKRDPVCAAFCARMRFPWLCRCKFAWRFIFSRSSLFTTQPMCTKARSAILEPLPALRKRISDFFLFALFSRRCCPVHQSAISGFITTPNPRRDMLAQGL